MSKIFTVKDLVDAENFQLRMKLRLTYGLDLGDKIANRTSPKLHDIERPENYTIIQNQENPPLNT